MLCSKRRCYFDVNPGLDISLSFFFFSCPILVLNILNKTEEWQKLSNEYNDETPLLRRNFKESEILNNIV